MSMGNNDQEIPTRSSVSSPRGGPNVLRNAWTTIRRGGAEFVIAGIDDRMTGKDDLDRTLAGRPERVPTVLMSHYPDFFEAAASRGVDLVLSGHTHGGQIAVPFIARRASLSRLARQTAAGLHVKDECRLYVNAGLGTTGPPLRVGVAPEIAVFVLRRGVSRLERRRRGFEFLGGVPAPRSSLRDCSPRYSLRSAPWNGWSKRCRKPGARRYSLALGSVNRREQSVSSITCGQPHDDFAAVITSALSRVRLIW